MPNGTYGGVRGEAGDDLTYSIYWLASLVQTGIHHLPNKETEHAGA
jgi:hypothetical protein